MLIKLLIKIGRSLRKKHLPIILETLILRYELKGKARTRPDIFRVVLSSCAQFYPCEASEQKWGQTPNLNQKR